MNPVGTTALAVRSRHEPAPVVGPAGVGWIHAGIRRSINMVTILAELAQCKGLGVRELLSGTELDVCDLSDPNRTVSFAQEFQLIRTLQRHCGDDPGLGLDAGELYRFTSLTWIGFAMLSSPTIRHAFHLCARYTNLGTTLVRLALEREGRNLHIAFMDDELPPDIRRFAVERTLAVGMHTYSQMLGRRVIPLSLSFGFPCPAGDFQVYERRLGVRPTFDAPYSRLEISALDADEPLANSNALALKIAEDHGRHLLELAAADHSLAMQVRRMIASDPAKYSDMGLVASAFCMSERTLRRHLQVEGTSFAALCGEVRESMAEQLLSIRRMSIEQVAARLGYAETSSFIHAFKRWKGLTPHVYRTEFRLQRGSARVALASSQLS